MENDADIVALVGASAALSISEVPFQGPIAAAKIGIIGEDFVINPSIEELKLSNLDLTVSGTKDSILMVESEVKELSEEEMIQALQVAQDSFGPVIDLINDFQSEAGKEKTKVEIIVDERTEELTKIISEKFSNDIEAAYQIKTKVERANKIKELSEQALLITEEETEYDSIKKSFMI